MLNQQSNETNSNTIQNSLDYQKRSRMYCIPTKQSIKTTDQSVDFPNLEMIIDTLDIELLKRHNYSFVAVEVLILEGIWQNKTYGEIAQENNYSSSYITNVAAPKLLKKLSKLLECRVTKKTCRSKLTKYVLDNDKIIIYKTCRKEKKQSKISMQYNNFLEFKFSKNEDLNLFLEDAALFARMN